MRRLALLGALLFFPSPLFAQEERPAPQKPITETAERIARDRWPADLATFTIDAEGRPRFRSGVTEALPSPPWQLTPDMSVTPTRGAISHAEMLRVMTPQMFSTPLIGGSADPGAIYNGIKKAWRERQARRVRARIEKELEQLRAASDSSN